ncbi:hypothetical protein EPA93_03765 [Ktedonosporobacter rubrisoli]|uniref:Uncharacterized protein n=1 Tax=Ktedonosporobacter rubrisoli TaxID=2509675 RepID=A0A4P6JJ69_KTERU|nr:hypothetical protein [Ktedonosporobacter rubrisoli]QBD75157.1 hypothetical protein EPA93_03765 [Ktedonosporobacter rubrisoli]
MIRESWKTIALARAEIITDLWEVAKAYAGRAAEWVLFLCMVVNIVEMLPGVNIAGWILNTVLGVQVVMLDIGGMSLGTMASHIREQGNAEAAKKADVTSKFLIGLMVVTLLLVSIGMLFPAIKLYTDMGEKGLILVRVVMTVIYGHVIHSLRSTSKTQPVPATPPAAVPDSAELEAIIRGILVPVLAQYRTDARADIAEQVKQALSLVAIAGEKEMPSVSSSDRKRLSPAPTSLASVRRMEEGYASRETRLSDAHQALLQEGIRPTGDTLSRRARCNRAVALNWLKAQKIAG